MLRGHAIYEGVYLLGTSIARPLIAKRQIAVAKKFWCLCGFSWVNWKRK